MTRLQGAALGAQIAAAVTAVLLARRRPTHRPAAVALLVLVVATLARVPMDAALTPHPIEPWQGTARVLVYLDGALVLAAVGVVPGLMLTICSPRPRRAIFGVVVAWALGSIMLAALYPSPLARGDGLRRIYLASDLTALAVSAVAFALWVRRATSFTSSPSRSPSLISLR